MPLYDLYSCPLYLDVQLLESNFKHFNWHHMLHFIGWCELLLAYFFILLACIMYVFSVVLALMSVPILCIYSSLSYCNETKLFEFIKFVNILPSGLDLAFDNGPPTYSQ